MESPHEDLTATLLADQSWFAVYCRPQRDGDWGAGFHLVEDRFHRLCNLAVQATSAGRRDPAKRNEPDVVSREG
jgi:hypothetical protein